MEDCLPAKNDICIRKSAFGRTDLFLDSANTATFKEIRCSASSVARQATISVYHKHAGNECAKRDPNICCWHCCYEFEGDGYRLPRFFDPYERSFHVYGWFCSPNCAKAYILEHTTFDRGYQMNIFVRMLREIYGITSSIVESPPRIALAKFGGPFSPEEFRSNCNTCLTVCPPFVSYSMLIEERPPISSIEEGCSAVLSQKRGTVRGLRRPASSVQLDSNEICSPPVQGLYDNFLSKQTEEAGPLQEVAKKKPRVTAKPSVASSSGLARFACKS